MGSALVCSSFDAPLMSRRKVNCTNSPRVRSNSIVPVQTALSRTKFFDLLDFGATRSGLVVAAGAAGLVVGLEGLLVNGCVAAAWMTGIGRASAGALVLGRPPLAG